MKLSEHIQIVDTMFHELVMRSKTAQEILHNADMSVEVIRKAWEHRAEVRQQRIESLCAILGIEVFWPGLYPSFKVDGFGAHTFADALAMTYGMESFTILKEREAQGFESKVWHKGLIKSEKQ
jgi:hypothetical protein